MELAEEPYIGVGCTHGIVSIQWAWYLVYQELRALALALPPLRLFFWKKMM